MYFGPGRSPGKASETELAICTQDSSVSQWTRPRSSFQLVSVSGKEGVDVERNWWRPFGLVSETEMFILSPEACCSILVSTATRDEDNLSRILSLSGPDPWAISRTGN